MHLIMYMYMYICVHIHVHVRVCVHIRVRGLSSQANELPCASRICGFEPFALLCMNITIFTQAITPYYTLYNYVCDRFWILAWVVNKNAY